MRRYVLFVCAGLILMCGIGLAVRYSPPADFATTPLSKFSFNADIDNSDIDGSNLEVILEDDFSARDASLWNVQCDRWSDNNACDYAALFDDFLRITWRPWDIRVRSDQGKRKGGAEIVERYQDPHSERMTIHDASFMRISPVVGETLEYSWDMRLVDLSALEEGYAQSAIVTQFHQVNSPDSDGFSPPIALLLKTDPGHNGNDYLSLQLKTPCIYDELACRKQECNNQDCHIFRPLSVSFPKSDREAWHTHALIIHWSPDEDGSVTWLVDGNPQSVKSASSSPWQLETTTLDKLPTLFDATPLYLKMGVYALRWPENFRSLPVSEQQIVVDFDNFSIAR